MLPLPPLDSLHRVHLALQVPGGVWDVSGARCDVRAAFDACLGGLGGFQGEEGGVGYGVVGKGEGGKEGKGRVGQCPNAIGCDQFVHFLEQPE